MSKPALEFLEQDEPTSPAPRVIDLRSDTVTRPTPAMRRAMAEAEVGDDVYGEDPTVNRLEAAAARIFGREAALFVPTGTMGNQIAIKVHTRPGQEIICEERAHILDWEMAMPAFFSGCLIRTLRGEDGILTWSEIKNKIPSSSYARAQTGLIELENTHNMAGGTVTPPEITNHICEHAHQRGIPVHLDGARMFNAAAALGRPVEDVAGNVDSVMFCLSKGLGAPIGSMLVGSRKFIDQARSVRKALGGGMRQAGILAAAGLIALEEMPQRLSEDHANARFLAEHLAALPQVKLDLATVQSNIVIFTLKAEEKAGELVGRLKHRGVLTGIVNRNAVRIVTHRDVDRAACELAAKMMAEEVAKL